MLHTEALFWVVPVIFALFAIAFGVVAWKERGLVSAAYAASAFAAASIGSIVDTQRNYLPPMMSVLATPAHWLCIWCLMQAMLARHGRSAPRLPVGLWVTLAFPAHIYFVILAPSVVGRTLLMNLSVPVLMSFALPGLWTTARQAIDKVLFGMVAVTIATYPVRLTLFWAQNQITEIQGTWGWSQYIIIFYLVITVLAVLTALALMLALGMDIVARHHKALSVDALTGIGNRRFYDQVIDADARGEPACEAALMIDLDHFKLLNDGHGHAAGDAVLVAVARSLQAKLAEFADVARIGGEEFAVLVRSGCGDGASALALVARAAVAAAEPDPPYQAVRATASVGMAVREPGEHLRDTLKRADIALYHAKSAGRDRVFQVATSGGLTTVRAVAA